MGNHRIGVSRCGILTGLFGITEMNERIRELALQARNYALDEKRIYERMHNTEQCMEEYREVYNKKFAELIVAECAMACEKNSYLALNGWQRAKQIKQHFGVEE
jgi:hypothetical protein